MSSGYEQAWRVTLKSNKPGVTKRVASLHLAGDCGESGQFGQICFLLHSVELTSQHQYGGLVPASEAESVRAKSDGSQFRQIC